MEKVETPVKSKKKTIKSIIGWVLFGFFGIIFAFILAGNIDGMVNKKNNAGQTLRFGWGSFVVLSESMEPKYMKDSAIVTYKEDIEKIYNEFNENNEAIIDVSFLNTADGFVMKPENSKYFEPVVTGQVMTHRVVEVHKDETKAKGQGRFIIITAGINPESDTGQEHQYQVFTEKQYIGVVKIGSNFLGQLFKFISSPIGLILLLLIPAGYLIVTSGIDIFKALKEKEEEEVLVPSGTASNVKVDSLSEKDKERLKQELLQEMMENKKKALAEAEAQKGDKPNEKN